MKLTAEAILARWRVAFIAAILLIAGGVKALELTHNRGYQPKQPILYSHKLHAGKLGIDCLYCHTNAEKGRYATVPPMETCMGCHSVVRTDRPAIQTLTEHFKKGEPMPWVRIHSLPDHVYFPHFAHVNAGVACQTCHGPIQEMEEVKQWVDLSMSFCIKCHRGDDYLRTPQSLAQAAEQGEFAHSFYRTGGAPKFDDDKLKAKYASVKPAFWSGQDLDDLAKKLDPEEMHEAIAKTLGYDSLARQEGHNGAGFHLFEDHVKAFQNSPINCTTCHQ